MVNFDVRKLRKQSTVKTLTGEEVQVSTGANAEKYKFEVRAYVQAYLYSVDSMIEYVSLSVCRCVCVRVYLWPNE